MITVYIVSVQFFDNSTLIDSAFLSRNKAEKRTTELTLKKPDNVRAVSYVKRIIDNCEIKTEEEETI